MFGNVPEHLGLNIEYFRACFSGPKPNTEHHKHLKKSEHRTSIDVRPSTYHQIFWDQKFNRVIVKLHFFKFRLFEDPLYKKNFKTFFLQFPDCKSIKDRLAILENALL